MTTELAARYDRLRADGFTRAGAILHLAESTGIDRDTVGRILSRAGRAAHQDTNVSARAGAASGPPFPAGGDSCTRPQRSDRRPATVDPRPRGGKPNRKEKTK